MIPRPPNVRDAVFAINGSPKYLGMIVSAGTVVNNATTATPFALPLSVSGAGANADSTACILLQCSAAGVFLPSSSQSIGAGNFTVALQTVVPPLGNTIPGVALTAGERVSIFLSPGEQWIQWLPLSGSANLLIWGLR